MLRRALIACLLLPLCAGAADPGRELVQQRMLNLVRDTALHSGYAETQRARLTATPLADAAAAATYVARELKRMGLKVSRSELPGGGAQIVADWNGRTTPKQVVAVAGRFTVGGDARNTANLAALLGVCKVYSTLLLKSQRTIRLVISIGAGDLLATSATTVSETNRRRHVAVIDGQLTGDRAQGIAAQLSARAGPKLETLRRALNALGPTEIQPDREFAAIAALRPPGIPAFGLLEAVEPTPATRDPAALRSHVALLATLAWWLGEMDALLPMSGPATS
jgi:hypothetical protein